jgi:hypothetical protein
LFLLSKFILSHFLFSPLILAFMIFSSYGLFILRCLPFIFICPLLFFLCAALSWIFYSFRGFFPFFPFCLPFSFPTKFRCDKTTYSFGPSRQREMGTISVDWVEPTRFYLRTENTVSETSCFN